MYRVCLQIRPRSETSTSWQSSPDNTLLNLWHFGTGWASNTSLQGLNYMEIKLEWGVYSTLNTYSIVPRFHHHWAWWTHLANMGSSKMEFFFFFAWVAYKNCLWTVDHLQIRGWPNQRVCRTTDEWIWNAIRLWVGGNFPYTEHRQGVGEGKELKNFLLLSLRGRRHFQDKGWGEALVACRSSRHKRDCPNYVTMSLYLVLCLC